MGKKLVEGKLGVPGKLYLNQILISAWLQDNTSLAFGRLGCWENTYKLCALTSYMCEYVQWVHMRVYVVAAHAQAHRE